MKPLEFKQKIIDGKCNSDFNYLYFDSSDAIERYASAIDEFLKLYPEHINDDIRIISAPGRTEIGGNHTDHQHGMVLAGSVNLDVIAIVAQNSDNTVRIKSAGYPMDTVKTDDLKKYQKESGKAISLIRGIMFKFTESGFKIGGIDAYTTSNVAKGSGLSSSAAFEVLVSGIFNRIFNNNSIDEITIAKISQFAERNYFDKPCGLLDQMASASGGVIFADFNSPEEPIVEKIEFDVNEFNHKLCVINTGGNHSDLTSDYGDITMELKNISRKLGVEFLRDADDKKFYSSLNMLKSTCGDRAVLRAHHFFSEEKRVLNEKKAIMNKDFNMFLENVRKSGLSSANYLQNLYSVSSPKNQGLTLALAVSEMILSDKGAYRVHGGGFAGTIQAYVPFDLVNSYREEIEAVFGKGSFYVLGIRPVGVYEI